MHLCLIIIAHARTTPFRGQGLQYHKDYELNGDDKRMKN